MGSLCAGSLVELSLGYEHVSSYAVLATERLVMVHVLEDTMWCTAGGGVQEVGCHGGVVYSSRLTTTQPSSPQPCWCPWTAWRPAEGVWVYQYWCWRDRWSELVTITAMAVGMHSSISMVVATSIRSDGGAGGGVGHGSVWPPSLPPLAPWPSLRMLPTAMA